MSKKFTQWNEVKINIEAKSQIAGFKEREIYWANIGIPLSTQTKEGSFYFEFCFKENQISTALLVQAKMYDAKRLDKKIGMIKKDDFETLKGKFGKLFGFEVLPQEDLRASPEGNCKSIVSNKSQIVNKAVGDE